MEQVATGTYRLGSRGHNFYLIIENDQVTIIDAGCSREWSHLTGALDQLGLGLDSVSGVVATHVHSDHLGLGKRAQDEGLTVSVHADDKPRALGTYEGKFSAGVSDLPLFSFYTLRNMWPMLRAGVMKFDHLEVVDTFVDGEVLDLPGRPRAVHTPGHTEGHTMFHCAETGLLFSGDGLVTMDLLGNSNGPQTINDVFSVDPDQARASLSKITDIEADLILPGHGDPWAGTPRQAVELITKS